MKHTKLTNNKLAHFSTLRVHPYMITWSMMHKDLNHVLPRYRVVMTEALTEFPIICDALLPKAQACINSLHPLVRWNLSGSANLARDCTLITRDQSMVKHWIVNTSLYSRLGKTCIYYGLEGFVSKCIVSVQFSNIVIEPMVVLK